MLSHRSSLAACAASLVAALSACAIYPDAGVPAIPATYLNPVLNADFPDPALLRGPDRWFYAYATQSTSPAGMTNIQVARSRDLVRWELSGDALPRKPSWAAQKQNFWAPHVTYDQALGTYYMYYSAEPDKNAGKCLAVATSAVPSGPFTDSGRPLICGDGIENIDPMAFDDPRTGKHLLYWGSGSKPIKVQELAADRLGFLPGSTPKEILYPSGQEYRTLIEAPWMRFRDGNYYLFYSGDRCCTRDPRYAVMVARSSDATGPFEELGTANGTGSSTILERNATWRAPGHNSVIPDDEGNDWILYHAMPTPGERRVMLLDRVTYEGGWPRIALGQPSDTPQVNPMVRP